ncbi:MAG: hypothetical protein IJZ29_05435 [Clostridia bacterium]|nr:hypothetical protein [Clostridia bacterium]
MKKFIICILLLIGFSGVTSVALVNSGFDGNARMIQTESISSNNITGQGSEVIDVETVPLGTNAESSSQVCNVILFEFAGDYGFYDAEKVAYLNKLINDNIPYNDVYSVHEYFYDVSYGAVDLYANFYLYQDNLTIDNYNYRTYNYDYEISTFNKANNAKKPVLVNYATGERHILLYSYNGTEFISESMLWSHGWKGKKQLFISYSNANLRTICHELLHTFNICDLYIDTSKTTIYPVLYWDLIANGVATTNTLMYNKLNMGWVENSAYEDANATAIETITQNGRYTLQPTTSWNGTRAIKFGVKQGDKKIYFMAEYRKKSNYGVDSALGYDGLIVYRVNEHSKQDGNLRNSTYETFEVYVYRTNEDDYCLGNSALNSGERCGSLSNQAFSLFYEDKSIAKFVIDNIVENPNGTVSFDFKDYSKESVVAGQVKCGAIPLSGLAVSLNGVEVASTDKNGEFLITGVTKAGTLTITDKNGRYKDYSIDVTPNSYCLKIAVKEVDYVLINFANLSYSETYTLYRKNNNQWEEVTKFSLDSPLYVKESKVIEYYKITGKDIKDCEFQIYAGNKSVNVSATKKSTIDKVVETVKSIPNNIGNAVDTFVDVTVETFEGIYNGLRSLF